MLLRPEAAAQLRDARERLLLTQRELAEKTGISVETISDLERGKQRSPRRRTIYALARTLTTIDPDELFELVEAAAS